MEHKWINTSVKGYFMAVAVLMYFFLTETINLGVQITYRHAFALVLFVIAFFCFLYKPNIARAITIIKPVFVYCFPLTIILLVSLFIWFMGLVDTKVIFRGLSGLFIYNNMLSFTLAAIAFLYIFGENGVWYNLIAILISNFLMLGKIVFQNGIGVFLREFVTLIITFAEKTGDVIVQAEIHELAFCLGVYLIYMLLYPKKNKVFVILLGLTMFCFLAAFKRIGVIAVAISLGLGWLLRVAAILRKRTAKNMIIIFSTFMVCFLIAYIAIIKLDAFTLLEKAGINTSGRAEVYNAVDKFYEFSPEFLGNGIGFLTYQLNTNMYVGVAAVHNDFLQYFIDLGFWGYILWLLSITLVRVCYFGGKGRIDNAIITFSLTVYLVIVSSTDNTMNYPLLTTVIALIMIGHGFNESVRNKEKNIYGYISKINQTKRKEYVL